jgi:hypothetical protein
VAVQKHFLENEQMDIGKVGEWIDLIRESIMEFRTIRRKRIRNGLKTEKRLRNCLVTVC